MRLTKITTKSGDKGMTSFGDGCNLISKGHPAIEFLGSIDELNAHIGLAKTNFPASRAVYMDLEHIQQKLFDMGGEVFMRNPERQLVKEADVNALLETIEFYNEDLPPLVDFVVPGAGAISAQIHIARTVCRRVEANAFRYLDDSSIETGYAKSVYPSYVRYLNRLSDFLFVLSRGVDLNWKLKEVVWSHNK